MVRRQQFQIDQAIESAVKDVPTAHVTNWCKHIRVKQVTTSLVGEMVGLPIGPKSVSCVEVGGEVTAQTYSGAAESFIESSCIGCEFHTQVSDQNYGIVVVERAQRRADDRKASQEAQQQIRELKVEGIDVDSVLAGDVSTDDQVKVIVSQLVDDDRKQRAAEVLELTATEYPKLFSPDIVQVMTGAFTDHEIGATVMRTALRLSDAIEERNSDVQAKIFDQAWAAVTSRSSLDQAGKIVADAVRSGHIEPSADTAKLLISRLGALVRTFPTPMVGDRPSRDGIKEALFEVYSLNPNGVVEEVLQELENEQPYLRAVAAAGADVLLEKADENEIAGMVDRLLVSLSLEDNDWEADPSLLKVLGKILNSHTELTVEKVLASISYDDEELTKLKLRIFRNWDPESELKIEWPGQLMALLGRPDVPVEIQSEIVELIGDDYRTPNIIDSIPDTALGVLALLVEQRDRIVAEKPKDDELATTANLEKTTRANSASAIVSKFREKILLRTLSRADDPINEVMIVLKNAATGQSTSFKAHLVRLVGELGREIESSRSLGISVVTPYLVTPDEQRVRAAAASAIGDLAKPDRRLPSDSTELLVGLLSDEYLHPVVSAAVSALRQITIADRALARKAVFSLVQLYSTYAGDSGESYFIEDVYETLLNLGRTHEQFAPISRSVLLNYVDRADRYSASKAFDDLVRISRNSGETHAELVGKISEYYERFQLAIARHDQLVDHDFDDVFFDMYTIERQGILQASESLLKLAANSVPRENPFEIGLLLLWAGNIEGAIVALELHVAGIPDETRYVWRKRRSEVFVALLRAEIAVDAGDTKKAITHLEIAGKLSGEAAVPASRPPAPLADFIETSEQPFELGDWVIIRSQMLNAPTRWDSFARQMERLADAVKKLVPEDTAAREKIIGRSANSILTGMMFLGRWGEAVRAGDSNSSQLQIAAVAQLNDAAQLMSTEGEHVFDELIIQGFMDLPDRVANLTPTTTISEISDLLGSLSLPCPRLGVRIERDQHSYRRSGTGGTPSEDPVDVLPPAIGLSTVLINDKPAQPAHPLITGHVYDFEVQLNFASLPEQTSKVLIRMDSTLPGLLFRISDDSASLDPIKGPDFVVKGHVIGEVPQSSSSDPVGVVITATAELPDGQSSPVELFGTRQISLRVVGSVEDLIPRSLPAKRGVEKLQVGLSELATDASIDIESPESFVIEQLVKYSAYCRREGHLRGDVLEADFAANLRLFLYASLDEAFTESGLFAEVKSGRGFLDLLIREIPVELKVHNSGKLETLITKSLPQATEYTIDRGHPIGFLVILDTTNRSEAAPQIDDDIAVYPGPTVEGIDPDESNRIAIGCIVIRSHTVVPSELRVPKTDPSSEDAES